MQNNKEITEIFLKSRKFSKSFEKMVAELKALCAKEGDKIGLSGAKKEELWNFITKNKNIYIGEKRFQEIFQEHRTLINIFRI